MSPMAALKMPRGQLGLIFTPEWFFDVIQFQTCNIDCGRILESEMHLQM